MGQCCEGTVWGNSASQLFFSDSGERESPSVPIQNNIITTMFVPSENNTSFYERENAKISCEDQTFSLVQKQARQKGGRAAHMETFLLPFCFVECLIIF